jgi:hypothetical protein
MSPIGLAIAFLIPASKLGSGILTTSSAVAIGTGSRNTNNTPKSNNIAILVIFIAYFLSYTVGQAYSGEICLSIMHSCWFCSVDIGEYERRVSL